MKTLTIAGIVLLGGAGLSATAGEVIRIDASVMPVERCHRSALPQPPARLTQSGDLFGRLRQHLRQAARDANAVATLVTAAAYEYADLTPGFYNPRWGGDQGVTAKAFADLAVTGRRSYDALAAMALSRAQLAARIGAELPSRLADWGEEEVDPVVADQAAANIAQRVHLGAWALRGPVDMRRELRPDLGWMAVSGEDDRPHRPVNLVSAPFPQRDIAITVGRQDLTVRAVFMGEHLADWSPTAARRLSHLPQTQPPPHITGDVLIFLHGHGSNAEEALSLAPHLFEASRKRGRELTILSLDLVGYAYSTSIDINDQAQFPSLPMDTFPNRFHGLDFIEASLDAVVAEIDRQRPGFSNRLIGVIGGSLGGNLGLRLAGRDIDSFRSPWLRNVISWSPASVWPSFADDCRSRDRGIRRCADEADLAPHIAQFILMFLSGDHGNAAAGTGTISLYVGLDAGIQRSLAVRATHENVQDVFHDGKRGNFYSGNQLQNDSQFSIADRWYRENWSCKSNAIEAGKWSIGEYFGNAYSPWHWRIANEQLVFSHLDQPRALFRHHRVFPKLLMISGERDNYKPEYIYENAIRLGSAMNGNYGRTLGLADTGHSVHAERPRFLAKLIVDFVYEVPPAIVMTINHL